MTPKNPDILYLMAQISISLKYYEDAIPLLEQSLQIAPGRSDIRAALGESYFKSGKFDKSIEEIEKLIEIDAIQHFRAALQASLDRTT
ncbi:MAG TPA: tetratricopeptide repeat protein [Edaphobacter sp.]|nr:tetratricopeptide repeat protein [Edaphobacter sp.]